MFIELVADYARNHASPRSLAASYSSAHAAAGLPIYQGMRHLQEGAIGYHPSAVGTTPQAVATANFLNSPAGLSSYLYWMKNKLKIIFAYSSLLHILLIEKHLPNSLS